MAGLTYQTEAESERQQRLELNRAWAEQNPDAWWKKLRTSDSSTTGSREKAEAGSVGRAGEGPSGGAQRADRRALPRPLSSGQILPHGRKKEQKPPENPSITIANGARFVGVRIPGKSQIGGGPRAAITRFTPKSRRRLLDFLNQVDQSKVKHEQIAFGTLTYPEEFPCARVSKKHIDAFLKRVVRRYPECPLIWKLEPQKRGAPHYHFLFINPEAITEPELQELVRWTATSWCEIVGSSDQNHLRWHLGELGRGNKPCVESVRSWQGVMSYASKYLAKLTRRQYEHFEQPGRWWGIINRQFVSRTLVKIELTSQQAIILKRQIRRFSERQHIDRFFIPGVIRMSGKHSPGQIIYGDQMFQVSTFDAPRPFRKCVEELQEILGRKIRQQRRRCFRGCGGISVYMDPCTAHRLFAWVKLLAPGEPPADLYADLPF